MRDRSGFTLLEVLVSLAILSTTLLLTYQVLSGAIAASERAERWTVASLLGDTLLHESLQVFPDVQETEGKFPAPNESYSWKRVVRQALHADAREVHVIVSWKADGNTETLTITNLAVK